MHWHSPSEYTVDVISFPLDAHFVHQLDDVALHGTYHRLAVIGLLYELGECNRSLDDFWSEFPERKTGLSFPLDAYFVHKLDGVALHGTYHRLAVIGLLYELGECNRSLDNFWSEFRR